MKQLKLKSGITLFALLATFALLFACAPIYAEELQNAESLFKKGESLFQQKQYDDAIVVFDDIDNRFGKSKDAKIREKVATALAVKGIILSQKGYHDKAIKAWEEADRRYGKDSDPDMRIALSRVLYNKLQTLVGLSIRGSKSEIEAALAAFDDFDKRYGKDKEPAIREMVAWGFIQKAVMFGHQFNDRKDPSDLSTYKTKEAIAALDEMVRRYGEDKEPDVRLPVAKALFEKGKMFFQAGKKQEEIAAFDELDRRFGQDETLGIRVMVIEGLSSKAWRLVQGAGGPHTDDPSKFIPAFEVMNEIIKRFGEDKNVEVQKKVIGVLLSKADAMIPLEDKVDEQDIIAIYDNIDRIYGKEKAPEIRTKVVEALCKKGAILARKKPKESLATFEEIDARYAKDETPVVREQVAKALNEKGKVFIRQNQRTKAIAAFDKVIQRYEGEKDMSDPVSIAEYYKNLLTASEKDLRELYEAILRD